MRLPACTDCPSSQRNALIVVHVFFSLWPLRSVCCPLRLRSIGKLEVKVSVYTVKPLSEGSRSEEPLAVMSPCTSHATPGSCRGSWPPPGRRRGWRWR